MGLVTGALQIGRSALQSYQSALQVIGNNISNAGNADYTRQTVRLSALHGQPLAEGLQPGAGVALTGLKRNLDESLENRLRAAIGELESSAARQQLLGRVETFFNELTGEGISAQMSEFFSGFANIQNDPANLGLREVTLSQGAGLASSLQRLRGGLLSLGEEINGQVEIMVADADRMASQIAKLNAEIAAAEGSRHSTASALRDQRDALLRDLSELFDVSVREQPDGGINVYIGSEPLIQGGVSRGLTTEQRTDGEFVRTTIRFADDGSQTLAGGGRIEGLIATRDEQAYGILTELDELAGAIIFEVNRIHADGQGLRGFSTVTGTFGVDDPTVVLNDSAAGLAVAPSNGSFFIAVTDDPTGTVVAYQIDVDLDGLDGDDTTLASLVADINATVEGVTASVTSDNRLQIDADLGFDFSFGHDGQESRNDTANLLAALGINTFFEGSTAADIQVNAFLTANAGMLAGATANLDGDGTNAGRMVDAGSTPSDRLAGLSVEDAYSRVANRVAVAGANALDDVEATGAVLSALRSQKESISGVNLDEEALELLKFERAYQGAARYVGTVDRMLAELMALIR